MQVTENLTQSDPQWEGNLLAHVTKNSQEGFASDELPLGISLTDFFSIFPPVIWGCWLHTKASSLHTLKMAIRNYWCYLLFGSSPAKEK